MPATADQLFLEALFLTPEARADLTDRLVASSSEALVPEIERAHLAEVRRRMARVEAGEVQPVPGEQVLAEGRALLAGLAVRPPAAARGLPSRPEVAIHLATFSYHKRYDYWRGRLPYPP